MFIVTLKDGDQLEVIVTGEHVSVERIRYFYSYPGVESIVYCSSIEA